MPEQSGVHFYVEWAKERLDEMDAILASLDRQAGKIQADQLIADLRSRRDQFQKAVKTQLEAGESAWVRGRAQLESQWDGFAAEVNKHLETFGKQVAVQQATFRDLAAAQQKAWNDAGEKLRAAAAGFAADRRVEIEGVLQQMKTQASEAEAKIQKVTQASTQSWTGLNTALAESRAAFDRAVQAACDAFKRAAEPKPER